MKHLLLDKEVWNHVEGTVEQAEEAEAPAKYEKTKRKAMTTKVGDGNLLSSYLAGDIVLNPTRCMGNSQDSV